MTKQHHTLTCSYGMSFESQEYRVIQKELIIAGKIRDAIAMDIRDIRANFGREYNESLLQMLKYAREQGYISKVQPELRERIRYE